MQIPTAATVTPRRPIGRKTSFMARYIGFAFASRQTRSNPPPNSAPEIVIRGPDSLDVLGPAPTAMEVAVPIAPEAAIMIGAAEHRPRSSSHCANRAADDGSHRTAHGGSGHRAARRADRLRRSRAGAEGKARERDKCDLVHDGDLMHPMRLRERGDDAFVPSVNDAWSRRGPGASSRLAPAADALREERSRRLARRGETLFCG